MSDPDRRADAQAGLTEPAWIQDVLKAVVEPTREDDHLGLFLGFIPNLEWLVLREGNPNATWPGLVEKWYEEFGVKFDPHRGDTPSRIIGDLNLAGWAAVMADLIRDVAVLACGAYKAPHALDIAKRYDICNRVVQLKDGLGGLPVFPELARVLGDFFTPAFERMAPPTEVRGHSSATLRWRCVSTRAVEPPTRPRSRLRSRRQCRMTRELHPRISGCFGAKGYMRLRMPSRN